jgi:hypothetical protein
MRSWIVFMKTNKPLVGVRGADVHGRPASRMELELECARRSNEQRLPTTVWRGAYAPAGGSVCCLALFGSWARAPENFFRTREISNPTPHRARVNNRKHPCTFTSLVHRAKGEYDQATLPPPPPVSLTQGNGKGPTQNTTKRTNGHLYYLQAK